MVWADKYGKGHTCTQHVSARWNVYYECWVWPLTETGSTSCTGCLTEKYWKNWIVLPKQAHTHTYIYIYTLHVYTYHSATCAPAPQYAASLSIPSSWIRVLSTSKLTAVARRHTSLAFVRRSDPLSWGTGMSIELRAQLWAQLLLQDQEGRNFQ